MMRMGIDKFINRNLYKCNLKNKYYSDYFSLLSVYRNYMENINNIDWLVKNGIFINGFIELETNVNNNINYLISLNAPVYTTTKNDDELSLNIIKTFYASGNYTNIAIQHKIEKQIYIYTSNDGSNIAGKIGLNLAYINQPLEIQAFPHQIMFTDLIVKKNKNQEYIYEYNYCVPIKTVKIQ